MIVHETVTHQVTFSTFEWTNKFLKSQFVLKLAKKMTIQFTHLNLLKIKNLLIEH